MGVRLWCSNKSLALGVLLSFLVFLLPSLAGLMLLALVVPAAVATAGLAWDYIFYFH